MAHIYNYNPKTDGWKVFPNTKINKIKIDQKMRGIREYDIPLTHYVKAGVTFCGINEPEGSSYYNDIRNQCDGCREGLRAQTIEAFALRDANDESKNVIDYAAAAKKDKPESSRVSH